MAQGFNDNLYLIDLSYLNTPSEIVYDLSSILDTDLAKNQRIKLKLGQVDFNKSQLLSIKSLIESINSTLSIVDGKSDITRNSAISIGLVYQNSSDMVPKTILQNPEESVSEAEYKAIRPELFPQNTSDNEENNIAKEIVQPPESSESIEIKPIEFNQNDDSINFEEEKNNNWLQTDEKNNNKNQDNIEKIQSPDNTNEETVIEELNTEKQIIEENNTEEITYETENKDNPEPALGIQSLADIPLDIPNDKEIQDELNIIYNTERKLENVFENTGLQEAKFQSLKDTPKAEEKEYTQYDFEIEAFPTKYLKQTICTGQFISFEGNLVIIGDCHEGSEISATGDITVWGELSGSAYAGKNGNEKCKIRALKMNASQLRISNCYVKRPSVLNNPNKQYTEIVPEEAKISKGEIVVYKIYK